MDLSIVVVSFNTKELLGECLESISGAKGSLDVEVFVVDNASIDGTCDLVRARFKWVKLIANLQNVGFSKANNQALRKAKGRYFLVLNPDTVVMRDTLVKMVDFMDKNKEIGIATCRVELANGDLDRDCRRRFPTPWRAFTHFSGLSKIFSGSRLFDQYNYGDISESVEHEIDACVGAFMIIRAGDTKKVGFFDEDFFFYGEDLDLCWRFGEGGYKIVYTPVTKIIHHKGAASGMKLTSAHLTKATGEAKKRAIRESTRAMRIFYRKHYLGKYPFVVTWAILATIKFVEILRLIRL